MSYRGDFAAGQVVRFRFSTYGSNNAPVTLAGSPTLAAYKDSGAVESSAGIGLTVDFDARTGLHLVSVDIAADAAFYAGGSDFDVVLTAGTVDGVTVAGTLLASFSIANRAATKARLTSTGVPASSSTPQSKLDWLFKLSRNKTNVTAAAIAVRNDADTADDVTATHTEAAGTYTRNPFM